MPAELHCTYRRVASTYNWRWYSTLKIAWQCSEHLKFQIDQWEKRTITSLSGEEITLFFLLVSLKCNHSQVHQVTHEALPMYILGYIHSDSQEDIVNTMSYTTEYTHTCICTQSMSTMEPLSNGHMGAGILFYVGRLSLSQRLTSKPHPSIPRLNLLRGVACGRSKARSVPNPRWSNERLTGCRLV